MMISVILEASENVDMIYIAGDKNHVSNSMEILCTLYRDLEVPHGNFLYFRCTRRFCNVDDDCIGRKVCIRERCKTKRN